MVTQKTILKNFIVLALSATVALLLLFTIVVVFSNESANAESVCEGGLDTGKACYADITVKNNTKIGTISATIGTSNPTTIGITSPQPMNATTKTCSSTSVGTTTINSPYNQSLDNNGVKKTAGWIAGTDGQCYWHYYPITVDYDSSNRQIGISAYSSAAADSVCANWPDGVDGGKEGCRNNVISATTTCLNTMWDNSPSIKPPSLSSTAIVAACIAKGAGGDAKKIETALKEAADKAQNAADSAVKAAQEKTKVAFCESNGMTYDPENADADDDSCVADNTKPTCGVESVGWAVCPVMGFLASVLRGSYDLVESMLIFDTKLTESNAANSAWVIFRNIANIFFVIAFLLIIYSQIVGGGGNR